MEDDAFFFFQRAECEKCGPLVLQRTFVFSTGWDRKRIVVVRIAKQKSLSHSPFPLSGQK